MGASVGVEPRRNGGGVSRWFRDGGWVLLAVVTVAGAALFANWWALRGVLISPAVSDETFLRAAFVRYTIGFRLTQFVLSLVVGVFLVRAIRSRLPTGRWPTWAVAFASIVGYELVAVLAALLVAAGVIGVWASALLFFESVLWVGLFLLWPPAPRAAASRIYLWIDVAIVAIAAGVTIWYLQVRPTTVGQAADWTQRTMSTVSWAAALVGLSAAVVRGSAAELEVAHRFLAAALVLLLMVNVGLLLFSLPGPIAWFVPALQALVMGALLLLVTEAIRRGWRWPGRIRVPADANIAPPLAVAAVGFLLIMITVRSRDFGLTVVLTGAMVVTLLLLARQVVTMRENARLLAERAAYETNARIAALVRHTSDIILVTDAEFRIRFASPSAEGLWSDRALELFGADVRELVDEMDRADADRALADSLKRPAQSSVARWRMPGAEGKTRRIEAVITSLLHEPSVNGVILTLRDQTERAELEEQLAQAQKMEAVGQLAGGIAHDFNNLLTTVLGHSELGMDSLEEDHPVRTDLSQIRKAAEMAAALTNQLLAFSRRQVIEPKVIDVHESLHQVSSLIKRLIEARVETVLQVDKDVGHVRMDPSQLEQAVLNLAINARDAMPQGGTLTISARRERTTFEMTSGVIAIPPGEYIVVEVTDTGTGMDEATQRRVFEPFFTTKPPGRGTGLGLASVYGIVKQNHGGLLLRSAVGEGTTFGIYLPRTEPGGSVADRATSHAVSAPTGATILLVEDEPWTREVTERVLTREGYRVVSAGDAVEARALAATENHHIDLLVTDIVMPGLSGPRLAAQLRQAQPDLKVLFISGYGAADGSPELGPEEALLRKPFTPVVLLETVRGSLGESGEAVGPTA
ncbi:MAG: response regulator [Gemmatimonadales bacterium]